MGEIVLHIMPMDHPSEFDLSRGITVDDFIFRDALQKLDFPSDDAGIEAIFCTPAASIEETLRVRDGIKAEILSVIGNIIDGWMAQFDTMMGYPKHEYIERRHNHLDT